MVAAVQGRTGQVSVGMVAATGQGSVVSTTHLCQAHAKRTWQALARTGVCVCICAQCVVCACALRVRVHGTCQLAVPAEVQEHVLRLKITVQHVDVVQVFKRHDDFRSKEARLHGRESPVRLKRIAATRRPQHSSQTRFNTRCAN